jgi:RND family efflux transporter MFP subunit
MGSMWRRSLAPAAILALVAMTAIPRPARADEPPWQSFVVRVRELRVVVTATAVIDPVVKVDVGSRASGEIARCRVDVGDHVEPGQLLLAFADGDAARDVNAAGVRLELARAALEVPRHKVEIARAALPRAASPTADPEVEADLRRAEGEVRLREIELEAAQARLDAMYVRSPIGGVVARRCAGPGETVRPGETLLTIVDVSSVVARAEIAEGDVASLPVGAPASVAVPAFPGRAFEGMIERVDPEGERRGGAAFFAARVAIANEEQLLRPGMSARVEVLIGQRTALLVPSEAILTRGGAKGVFVPATGGREWREVVPGVSQGAMTEVLEGLIPGETILVPGP